MENQYDHLNHEKQNVSSTQSVDPPISNSPPESTSSALPPPYAYPAQPPPPSGMPYPQYYQPLTPDMGYAQPYASPPGGQPYYPQQQQQQVVVMNDQPKGVAPVVVARPPPVSMVGAIVLSCIVFWCFGWVFGGIAFILAMVGQSSAAAGDTRSAIHMRNASYGLSIAGIIVAVIIIAVVAGIVGSALRSTHKSAANHCYDSYYGYYYYC